MYLKTQIENLLRLAQEQESYEPYKEVLEKITLTGAEYFELGYKVSDFEMGDTIRFEGIIKGTDSSSIPTSGSQLVFSLGNDGGQWLGKAQNGTKYAFGSSNVSTINFNEEVLADVTIALSGSASRPTFTITGSVTSDTATSTITQRSATPTYYDFPLLFGAGTKSTGEKSYGGDYTIKCGKIYINGTMTKDYVPALDSQMRPCLYDKISKTFTYAKKISDGTTTYDLSFKRWNKFDVDYIESSGTQYINTGYAFADDFAYEVEYEGLNNGECLLGGRTSSVRTAILYRAMATQVDGQTTVPIAGLNATQTPFKLGVLSDTKHKVKVAIANNKGNVWVDDTQVYTNQSFTGTYISGKTTAIFADHFGDLTGTSEYQEYATSKLYALKFWQGTTLVRDYKPVVWHNGDTTAEACLYDEVYNKMHTNAGTGTLKAYIENTLGVPYEVGMYIRTVKTSTQATIGPIIELGEYPQDGMGYHIKTTTNSASSNYLFGSRITTGENLQIVTLSGSQTGGTILSTVMGESITWKSGTTTWARNNNGTTYECSIQTYKDGNTYKFNAIGYNYTLGKEADRQTQTYTNPIDEQQDAPMLCFGAFNTANILFGTNSHYFVEWNLPNVRHTLLPVINTAHTQFCFIDNKTKEIYEFTKVGSYAPTTNNISFKQLDGTVVTGTL